MRISLLAYPRVPVRLKQVGGAATAGSIAFWQPSHLQGIAGTAVDPDGILWCSGLKWALPVAKLALPGREEEQGGWIDLLSVKYRRGAA